VKVLLWGGLGLFAFGLLGSIPVFVGIGFVGVAAFLTIKLTGWGARTTKRAVSNSLAERRDEKDFQKNLRRKVEEERAMSAVRNEATIQLLREQVALIAAHKREGANVEREIYDMRVKLLEFERQENNAMIGDLIKTLDGI
jgi:flagellar biosynthesis component FlhA